MDLGAEDGSVHRSPALASASASGTSHLLFSHELIRAPGVDSRAVVSSSLQVTSYWRHGGADERTVQVEFTAETEGK